jgi:hypothetical protein
MAFNGTGSNVTSLNATNISSGTVPTARLGSGTANSSTFLRGDQTYASVAGAPNPLHGKQVFTSSGTFNVPTGVTAVKASVIGAGGNGAAYAGCAAGGGGGAGGYVVDYVAVTPGGTATVTVGTNAGTRTSSFAGGTTLTASGGSNGSSGVQGLSAAATVFGQTYYQAGTVRTAATGITGYSYPDAPVVISGSLGTRRGSVYGHGYGVGGNTSGDGVQNGQGLGMGAGGGGGVDNLQGTRTGSNGGVIVEW